MRIGRITVPLSSEHEFAKEAIVLNDATLVTLKTSLRGELIQGGTSRATKRPASCTTV
jgi:hypothetical protein